MAFDPARGRVTLFGGTNGSMANDSTIQLCCFCDDEVAVLDPLGNVVFPPTLEGEVDTVDTEVDLGDISDEFPDFHTSADSWYEKFPCLTAIGGTVPGEASNPAVRESLETHGVFEDPQVIADSISTWDQQASDKAQGEPDPLLTAGPVGPPGASYAPETPWCPADSGVYVFGGRDIVFIHGLKLDHLFDRMFGKPEAQVDWIPPTTFPGSTQNPSFYNAGGYYRDTAIETWADHIRVFMEKHQIRNRYVIVSYPCNARFAVGIPAILTQISDAMIFGTNVVNPPFPTQKQKFGSPSFVIVSHSTGGMITNAALWAAVAYPNLKAERIVQRCKAHVALAGAFGGSKLASAGLKLTNYLGGAPPAWLCPLVKSMLPEFDDVDLLNCPVPNVPVNSVLVDLSPRYAKVHWGTAMNHTGVRTVQFNGGHPTFLSPVKIVLHSGLDDGVLNNNTTAANPGEPLSWPHGFVTYGPPGLAKTFDMGITKTRAVGFYIDQVYDNGFEPATSSIPFYVATSEIRDISTTGMLQTIAFDFPNTAYDALQRYNSHYTIMGSTADHFSIRNGKYWPYYKANFGSAVKPDNWEEIRTIREVDEPALREKYTPGGDEGIQYAQDDQELLAAACVPPVSRWFRGTVRGIQDAFVRKTVLQALVHLETALLPPGRIQGHAHR